MRTNKTRRQPTKGKLLGVSKCQIREISRGRAFHLAEWETRVCFGTFELVEGDSHATPRNASAVHLT